MANNKYAKSELEPVPTDFIRQRKGLCDLFSWEVKKMIGVVLLWEA